MKGQRQKFKGSPAYFGTGFRPYYPPMKISKEFNLSKSLGTPLHQENILKDIGDEGLSYNSMGAFLMGVTTKDEEMAFIPFENNSSLSSHYRWTMGARKVAEIERLNDPEKERNLLIREAFNAKLITLTDEDHDKAEDLGIFETWNI